MQTSDHSLFGGKQPDLMFDPIIIKVAQTASGNMLLIGWRHLTVKIVHFVCLFVIFGDWSL